MLSAFLGENKINYYLIIITKSHIVFFFHRVALYIWCRQRVLVVGAGDDAVWIEIRGNEIMVLSYYNTLFMHCFQMFININFIMSLMQEAILSELGKGKMMLWLDVRCEWYLWIIFFGSGFPFLSLLRSGTTMIIWNLFHYNIQVLGVKSSKN